MCFLGDDGNNKKLIIILSLSIFAVIIIIGILFGYLYFRNKENDPPLLGVESFSEII